MTFVITLVLGMGLILIVSALDGTPVAMTFAKILAGGSGLDLSGAGTGASASTTTVTTGTGSGTPPSAGVVGPTSGGSGGLKK